MQMNKEIFTQADRLVLRKFNRNDYLNLCGILQDEKAMYAYEGAFSDGEVQAWLDNQLHRYREEGVGLYAVELKDGGRFVGQCGLTMQDIPGGRVLEIGYLFRRDCWHNGYATEAAKAIDIYCS